MAGGRPGKWETPDWRAAYRQLFMPGTFVSQEILEQSLKGFQLATFAALA
jgi:hypothetical protein